MKQPSALALLALAVVYPTAASAQEAWSLDRILKRAAPQVEAITDIASWVGQRPDPTPEFDYAETRRFDMQLHQSMGADLPNISVRVNGAFNRNNVPERMSRWIKAVDKNGDFRTCIVDDGSKGFFSLINLILMGAARVDEWMLYRPANRYDGMMIVAPDGAKVMNVVFSKRGTMPGCPDGTMDAAGAAERG